MNLFPEREVSRFGAPTLITRTTIDVQIDVQQVQIFVMMACTMRVSAAILAIGGVAMALRQVVGHAGGPLYLAGAESTDGAPPVRDLWRFMLSPCPMAVHSSRFRENPTLV